MNQSFFKSDLGRFRFVAFLEGISFIVLLFIAMPLKYLYDMPLAVRIVGSVHGLLFVLFVYYLAVVSQSHKWQMLKIGGAFVASLLPFGTFVLDRRIKNEEKHIS